MTENDSIEYCKIAFNVTFYKNEKVILASFFYDFGEGTNPVGQGLWWVTPKVLSNSKHTLLCLYGHNVLARINLIPLKTLRWFAQWLEAQSLQGTAHFLYAKGWKRKNPEEWVSFNVIPRDEQKCILVCHTFYMSYDKNVKRMTSMYICLHASLHWYFFIKLQPYFYTTVNQYVNKSIRQWIIEMSKMRPFLAKGICPSIELQDNGCFLFCSVQPLDDGITKLRCTIGG